jgi:hypothetical protein
MGKIPLLPLFFEKWLNGVTQFVRREHGRFVQRITDYSFNFEHWSTGHRAVWRDERGRFLKWEKAPEPAVEEEELEEEPEVYEEPEEMFRQTVALRGVKRREYFNVVAHYYSLTEEGARAMIPELMKRILKKMYEVAGYHKAAVEDFRVSDVARIRYEWDALGEFELEEEWEL